MACLHSSQVGAVERTETSFGNALRFLVNYMTNLHEGQVVFIVSFLQDVEKHQRIIYG